MIIGMLVVLAENVSSEDWLLKLSESSSDFAQRDLEKAPNGEGILVSDRSTHEGIRCVYSRKRPMLWYTGQDYYFQHRDAGRRAVPPMTKNRVLSAASMKNGEMATASLIVPAMR